MAAHLLSGGWVTERDVTAQRQYSRHIGRQVSGTYAHTRKHTSPMRAPASNIKIPPPLLLAFTWLPFHNCATSLHHLCLPVSCTPSLQSMFLVSELSLCGRRSPHLLRCLRPEPVKCSAPSHTHTDSQYFPSNQWERHEYFTHLRQA